MLIAQQPKRQLSGEVWLGFERLTHVRLHPVGIATASVLIIPGCSTGPHPNQNGKDGSVDKTGKSVAEGMFRHFIRSHLCLVADSLLITAIPFIHYV